MYYRTYTATYIFTTYVAQTNISKFNTNIALDDNTLNLKALQHINIVYLLYFNFMRTEQISYFVHVVL